MDASPPPTTPVADNLGGAASNAIHAGISRGAGIAAGLAALALAGGLFWWTVREDRSRSRAR